MYLDPDCEKVVRDIWNDIIRADIASNCQVQEASPHVSLALMEKVNIDHLMERLKDFVKGKKPLPVRFYHTGTFLLDSGIVFLAPVVTREILDFHASFHKTISDLTTVSEYYLPGHWVPHCTLTDHLEPEYFGKVVKVAQDHSLPLKGWLSRIGVIEYPPIKEICTFDLG
jgi:hypothetical protein